MKMDRPIVGYAGMTHLGINSAVAGAERGFQMVCFDPDVERIAALNQGQLPVVETNLPELIDKNRSRIVFTTDPQAISTCDIVYVAPDVPTDESGASDLGPLRTLLAIVDRAMRPDAILVLLSQVPPGFTRELSRPKSVLYYQVETLIFGQAVERALKPERFIIGCADPATPLPVAYRAFLEAFECPLLPMRYESAELAKISINCCLVASVSVANTLAELCERLGADWSEIVPALKLDKRIGPHAYLAPGLGISGGNLERDLATVCRLANANGSDAGVVRAWISDSHYRKDWALRALHRHLLPHVPAPRIAVWGLAYKQDTHSTKNSPSLALIADLTPFALTVYDPVVPATAAPHPRAEGAPDPLTACRSADALVIMTPWKQFRNVTPADIAATLKGHLVIDPYQVLDRDACAAANLMHLVLGRPPPSPSTA